MNEVDKILKLEKFPQILLLFGEEEFLINEDIKKIRDYFEKIDPSNTDLDILDGEKIKLDELISRCRSIPFISPKRLVIVDNFEKLFKGNISKKIKENSPFTAYLKNPSDSTFLVLISYSTDLKGLSKLIKSTNTNRKIPYPYDIIIEEHIWCEYPKVWDNQISNFITSRLKSKGYEITPNAAEMFALHCNTSLREIVSEIEKLIIFLSDRKKIDVEDIDKAIGINREFNVFELQNALAVKNVNKSLFILQKILSHESGLAVLIISVLNNFFKVLLKLVELQQLNLNQYQLASKLGVNPIFVKDYLNSLKYYSYKDIENAFQYLLEADLKIKSVSTDKIVVLQEMILKITSKL